MLMEMCYTYRTAGIKNIYMLMEMLYTYRTAGIRSMHMLMEMFHFSETHQISYIQLDMETGLLYTVEDGGEVANSLRRRSQRESWSHSDKRHGSC